MDHAFTQVLKMCTESYFRKEHFIRFMALGISRFASSREYGRNMSVTFRKMISHSRDAVARHGPVGPQIYGTARPGKSWHGTAQKILARRKKWHGMARKTIQRNVFTGGCRPPDPHGIRWPAARAACRVWNLGSREIQNFVSWEIQNF